MIPSERIRWVAAINSMPLPSTAYRLAAHMAFFATDGTGVVWCSRSTLASAMGCDKARLPRAFQALEKNGFICRGALSGPPGRKTYRWHLTMPNTDIDSPSATSALPPSAVSAPSPSALVAMDPVRSEHYKVESKGIGNGGSGGVSTPLIDQSKNSSTGKPPPPVTTSSNRQVDTGELLAFFGLPCGPKDVREWAGGLNRVANCKTFDEAKQFMAWAIGIRQHQGEPCDHYRHVRDLAKEWPSQRMPKAC